MEGICRDDIIGLTMSQRTDWKVIFTAKSASVRDITNAIGSKGMFEESEDGEYTDNNPNCQSKSSDHDTSISKIAESETNEITKETISTIKKLCFNF